MSILSLWRNKFCYKICRFCLLFIENISIVRYFKICMTTVINIFVYLSFKIYLTESLSNVISSTLDGIWKKYFNTMNFSVISILTFSALSWKWSILIRFSLCDLSLGAPCPGLNICTIIHIWLQPALTFPSRIPRTRSAASAADHPSFCPAGRCWSSLPLVLQSSLYL